VASNICQTLIVGHPVALAHWPHWHALLQYCVARGAYLGRVVQVDSIRTRVESSNGFSA
jgi:hypothetical protein